MEASVCQLNVMYTRCDKAITNTMVPRFAVSTPIFLPKSDCTSNVDNTALMHVASIPMNNRADRNTHHIVTPNRTTAVRLK